MQRLSEIVVDEKRQKANHRASLLFIKANVASWATKDSLSEQIHELIRERSLSISIHF